MSNETRFLLSEERIPRAWYNITEALRCKQEGTARTILFNLSGHGHFDMQAYTDYFAGKLTDQPHDEAAMAATLGKLPEVAAE